MVELPDLLLSYGIALKKSGNEYQCLCYAHDDHTPSMSVYRNGNGHWNANCHACGAGGSVIKVYCQLSGLDPDNTADMAKAYEALELGIYTTGKPYAVIHNEPPGPPRPERTMLPPPADAGLPKMGWIEKDGIKFGEPHEVYIYRQPGGDPWYYEARWDLGSGKQCLCFTWGRRGSAPAKWECSHHLPPRPLYGLDHLHAKPDAQAVICEGPRKAAAAQQLLPMVACIGWAGGARGWRKSDWTPLAGRTCILWPDADEVGREVMADLARTLIAQGCTCYILDTTAEPAKWDARDALDDGWDAAQTLAWAKAHKGEPIAVMEKKTPEDSPEDGVADPDGAICDPQEPPEYTAPLPLETYASGTAEFTWPSDPADLFGEYVVPGLKAGMLPDVVQDFVDDRAHIINTEPAYGALCCIVTAAGMIDDRIRIKVKADEEWYESARLWGCIVGEPSSRKSPMQRQCVGPLSKIIEKVAKEDSAIAANQEILDAKYEKKWKEYKSACIDADDHSGIERPVPPPRPERHHVKIRSFTMEALEEVLRDCPRGIFVDVDELSGLIGSLDAHKQNGSKKDRAQILEAYEGGPYQKAVISRGGAFTIPNFSATILGGIQPSKMRQMQIDLSGDGFLQRFLVVCSTTDGGNDRDDPPNAVAIRAWADLLDHLYHLKPGGHYVDMTPGARAVWRKATDTVHDIIRTRMIGPAFTSHLGKYNGIGARMILTYHCIESAIQCRHPESWPVQADTARKAMAYLLNHLLPHAMSFYEDGLGQSEPQEAAKLIAGQIVAEGKGELTTTWLHKSGPKKWRAGSQQLQHESLNRLVEYGWIAPCGGINNATRRPTRYLVNPHVHSLFERHKATAIERIKNAQDIGRKIRAGSIGDVN